MQLNLLQKVLSVQQKYIFGVIKDDICEKMNSDDFINNFFEEASLFTKEKHYYIRQPL